METNTLFKETQLGLKNWILLLIIIFTIIPLHIHLLFKMYQKTTPESYIFLGLVIFLTILCILLAFIKLDIEIFRNKIQYRLFPFHFSTQVLLKSEIVKTENVVYNPIGEWGGWGIRNNSKGDKAYNMYGNKGVQVTLKNGRVILFGSQKPNELYDAINQTLK